MLVHLKTQQQISDAWPTLRELIRKQSVEEIALCPAYTNNILTHALINMDTFQLCLHFSAEDLENPTSFVILDINYDSLLEKRVCFIPLWLSLRSMHKQEVLLFAKDLIGWLKGLDCEIIRAHGHSERLMHNEVQILKNLGLLKDTKTFYGWYAQI